MDLLPLISLRPNVTREQAEEMFGHGLWRRLRLGPLRSVGEVFVPFRIYSAEIENARRKETRVIGVDAVNGSLDIYSFDTLPDAAQMLRIASRNVIPSRLTGEAAAGVARQKLQRVLFQSGFFKLRDLRIEVNEQALLHVPYWAGFFGRGERANLAVIDAVRRAMEGGRVRQMIMDWLESPR